MVTGGSEARTIELVSVSRAGPAQGTSMNRRLSPTSKRASNSSMRSSLAPSCRSPRMHARFKWMWPPALARLAAGAWWSPARVRVDYLVARSHLAESGHLARESHTAGTCRRSFPLVSRKPCSRSNYRYKTDAEAVERANNTLYGLAGSVWTQDPKAGAELADKLVAGTGWVNQHTNLTGAPFGGFKESGLALPW